MPADTGRSLGGFVIPVAPRDGDLLMSSLRVWRWRTGDTQRVLLEGDVLLNLDGWSFETDQALVWIDRVPSAAGVVTQVVIFMPQTRPGTHATTSHARGRNLLVVGTLRGRTLLDTALVHDVAPPAGATILTQGEQRLADYVASVRMDPPLLSTHPTTVPGATVPEQDGDLPLRGQYGSTDRTPWLHRPGATIAFSADAVVMAGGEEHATIVADGAVAIEYRPLRGGDQYGRMRMTAERAVIFLQPGTLQELTGSNLSADDVRGVYLEGGVTAVAERDDYEVRAPRMFYDFQTDQAIMLDAVLRTYDRKRGAPVIARADELRQLAQQQWSMKNVVLSASSFAVPTLALASREAKLTRTPPVVDTDGAIHDSTIVVEGTGNTIQAGGMPIFYWPHFKGSPQNIPLRGIRTGWDEDKGALIETTWDIYALLGMESPRGETLELDVDAYGERGVGAGVQWSRYTPDSSSSLRLYGLMDSGTQRTDAGLLQAVPRSERYEAVWEDTTMLSPEWMLQTQLSKFSDSTFISAWREDSFRNRRQYETAAFLKWQDDAKEFSLLVDFDLNDFVSNSWLLASQGFSLDEMPRASLRFFGADIMERLTWTSEWHISRFRANIAEGTPSSNGVFGQAFLNNNDQPLGDNDSIADNLAATENIHDNWAMRAISSHHIAMPLHYGSLDVTPFVVGQIQGFLEKEANMDPDAEDMRAIGGAGVTLSTTVQRVWNDVEDRVLDLHRLRAVLEPSVTAFYSGSNFDPADALVNPQYDPWFDDTSRGGALRLALRSTLQTMRGGPGQWFDVDWLKFEVGAVFSHDASPRRYSTPQWFQSNPLFSQLGNFSDGRVRWQLGEGVAAIGEGVWDFDNNHMARGSGGVQLTHSPRFTTSAEYRYIEVPDSFINANTESLINAARGELLSFNAQYEVGKKYDIRVQPVWNFSENDWQSFRADIRRSYPDFDLDFYIRYDQIRDETSAGVRLGQTRF